MDIDDLEDHSKDEIKKMMTLIEEFVDYEGQHDTAIDTMFPTFYDPETALQYCIKSLILYHCLTQNILADSKKVNPKIFSNPKTRELAMASIALGPVNYAANNCLLRLLARGKLQKDHNSFLIAYDFIKRDFRVGGKCLNVPATVQAKFSQVSGRITERQNAYLKVRLTQIIASKNYEDPTQPKMWHLSHSLSILFSSQLMFGLEAIVDGKEFLGKSSSIVDLIESFQADIKLGTLKESSTNTIFFKYITVTLDNIVMKAMEKPKYQPLEPLDTSVITKILQAGRYPDNTNEEKYFDFEVLQSDLQNEESLTSQNHHVSKKKPKSKPKIAKTKSRAPKKNKYVSPTISSTDVEGSETNETSSSEKASDHESDNANDNVEAQQPAHQKDLSTSPSPVSSDTSSASTNSTQTVEDEIQELLKEHEETLERYKVMNKLKIDHSKWHGKELKIIEESKIPLKRYRTVAFFSTDDWRMIHEEANKVFVQNQVDETANLLNSKSHAYTFKWVFNPSVEIKADTFKFLCQLFNLTEGTNNLTFNDFLKAFVALNPGKAKIIDESLNKKKTRRTVFQFDHAVECNGNLYIPPIGGVHREHLSSRFNYIQIRKFFMHAGAHPYFFIPVLKA